MKKSFAILCSAAFISLSASAAIPDGYYDSLEGKCGTELMRAAKDAVRTHKVISYGSSTWDCFKTTDYIMVDGRKAWWDMYSNNIVYVRDGHEGLNIEHSVANSWWGKTKNDAYKDLFHLNPSDATANNRKSNYPLGEVGTVTWTNGPTTVGKPVSGQGGGCANVFEPADEYKGDFARAFMYIFTVYNDITWKENTAWMYDTANTRLFKPWAIQLLLKWSDNDPVDEKETNRNEAIYGFQTNRNPFIDHPDLAHYIWGDKNTTPWYADGSGVDEIELEEMEISVSDGCITAPDGARVFDLGGRECSREALQPGIYIVAKPGAKTVKVIVR